MDEQKMAAFRNPQDGSQVVIFNEDKTQVLLVLREDFRIWVTPGGRADEGESFEQCAAREAYEETGYDVAIDYFLGEYERPQRNHISYVYVGRVIGGDGSNHSWESLAVKWFALDNLPKRMLGLTCELITDARFATELPLKRTQIMPTWQVILINAGTRIRDTRNYVLGR